MCCRLREGTGGRKKPIYFAGNQASQTGHRCELGEAADSLRRVGLMILMRACLKIPWGPVFAQKAVWQGATSEHTRSGL
jgi:hypothetical protein